MTLDEQPRVAYLVLLSDRMQVRCRWKSTAHASNCTTDTSESVNELLFCRYLRGAMGNHGQLAVSALVCGLPLSGCSHSAPVEVGGGAGSGGSGGSGRAGPFFAASE